MTSSLDNQGSRSGATSSHPWSRLVPNSETVITGPRAGDSAAAGQRSSSGGIEPVMAGPASAIANRLFPLTGDNARTVPLADAVQGMQVAHFVIERRIGMGGMGAVFLAQDERLGRQVALKVLAPHLATDESAVQRFRNEARAAARLDDDHIARVFFSGEADGLHYIAYEYVAGTNLRDIIRQHGKLDVAESLQLVVQLTAALLHMTTAGVVHRDIKPSNIIITPAGRAKLVDLGLARHSAPEGIADLTVAGTTLGTFDYISPEQAKDPRNVDVRSDIYSLGCTYYHMLTGEPPYPEGTMLQKLLDHQASDPPDPVVKNRRVPAAISQIVRKMMSADPRRRYGSPEALLIDLGTASAAMGVRTLSIDPAVLLGARHLRPSFWQQHLSWIATTSALLLLVLAMQFFPSATQYLAGNAPGSAAGRNGSASDGDSSSNPRGGSDWNAVDRRSVPSRDRTVERNPDVAVAAPFSATDDDPAFAMSTPPANANRGPADAMPGTTGSPVLFPSGTSIPLLSQTASSFLGQPLDSGPATAKTEGPRASDAAALTNIARTNESTGGNVSGDSSANGAASGVTDSSGPNATGPNSSGPNSTANIAASNAGRSAEAAGRASDATLPAIGANTGASTGVGTGNSTAAVAGTRPDGDSVVLNTISGSASPTAAGAAASTAPAGSSANITGAVTGTGLATDATGAAIKPGPSVTAPAIPPFQVVGGRSFDSFEAACATAKDGSVILLQFDGSRGEVERPLRISSKHLTVRAGAGYQPRLEFAPSTPPPDGSASRMITVIGGSLELVNVELLLRVPEQFTSDMWALLSLEQPERLVLERVTATIVNPRGQKAVIVEQVAPPGASAMGLMKGGSTSESEVTISDSLLRGQCEVVRLRDGRPSRYWFKDSVIAVDDSVFTAMGVMETAVSVGQWTRLELSHVTCITSHSLISVQGTDDFANQLIPLQVVARNNLIACNPVHSLVEIRSDTDAMDLGQLFTWTGEKNLYDNVQSFWTTSSRTITGDQQPLDFKGWTTQWGGAELSNSLNGPIRWKSNWKLIPKGQVVPVDVALDPAARNSAAIGGATDGRDIGADLTRVPVPVNSGRPRAETAARPN